VTRLLRILLNAATALSLLLCVATAVAWPRSHWRAEWFESSRHDPASGRSLFTRVGWSRGELFLVRVETGPGNQRLYLVQLGPYGRKFVSVELDPTVAEHMVGLKPVQYESSALAWADGTSGLLLVKMWLPFACFAILPTARGARRVLRRRRTPPGACAACGYDLRATPERCPECGHRPS
jgi:hypothetical protein